MAEIDLQHLREGDRRSLAKAITLVESSHTDHRQRAQELLNQLLPYTGNSIRVGISGVPGVGKSTFIEAFGLYLIKLGKKVAVLAVDPSSPVAGGSILGDKTRMEELSRNSHAFIRPSPASGALGGVANKTRESLLLCEAAGYDVILVETVGVGQSEYEVAGMVDFFLVLMLPNAGDELQGIKRGIMELADALVVNKADGDSLTLAEQTRRHYENALQLIAHPGTWRPRVQTCSALNNRGIQETWSMIEEHTRLTKEEGSFTRKRANQNINWMRKLLSDLMELRLRQNPQIKTRLPSLEQSVIAGETSPYAAAKTIIDML